MPRKTKKEGDPSGGGGSDVAVLWFRSQQMVVELATSISHDAFMESPVIAT